MSELCSFQLPVEVSQIPNVLLQGLKKPIIIIQGKINNKGVREIYAFCDNKEIADYIVQAINGHEKLTKHIEALKSVCETYIPTDQMDEANSKVILLCMENVEEIGRKLLAKQALEAEQK